MKNCLVLLISLYVFTVNAQPPGVPGGNASAFGIVNGQIVDDKDATPIEYASVSIKDADGNLINGVITDADGKFALKKVPFDGLYSFEVSFVGYLLYTQNDIGVSQEAPMLSLGEIRLEQDAEILEEVEVIGEYAAVQTSLDKKVFNVEKNIANAGGTASDVLDDVPSVNVDIDGTISLRGNTNVRILIDGESSLAQSGQVELVLQQIPANSIERIEVLNNPSSKYDPEGTSGIINIILKKEKRRGVNGTVSAGVGTWNKYNASTFVMYKNKLISLTSNYSFRYWDSYGDGSTNREYYNLNSGHYFNQVDENDHNNMSHFGRLAIDFSVKPRHTIGVSGFGTFFKFNRDSYVLSELEDQNETLEDYYKRSTLFNGNGRVFNGSLNHKFDLKENKGYIKTAVAYNRFLGNFDGGFREDGIDLVDLETQSYREEQETQVDAQSDGVTINLDFEKNITETINIDAGYQTELSFRIAGFNSASKENITDDLTPDTDLNNQFNYQEHTHAGYANYKQSIKNFSLQFGTRLEYTTTNSNVITTNQKFENDYFAFYPSIYLNQKIGKDHELQLSYSRRVNRPSMRIVNPFRDFSENQNIRQGNPFLKPEFINSMELGYNKVWDKVTFNTAFYYKMTTDYFTQIQREIEIDGNTVLLTTHENLGRAHDFGWELVNRYSLFDWWEVNLDFNLYRSIIEGGNLEVVSDLYVSDETEIVEIEKNKLLSYNGRITTDFNLWKGAEFQISGKLRGPRIRPQGRTEATGDMDLALKQTFLNDKATLTLSVNDVLGTQQRNSISDQPTFYQEEFSQRETRIFFLTFSYGFGKMGAIFNKRAGRNGGGNDGGSEKEEGVF